MSEKKEYIIIKQFHEHQHYSDRNIIWIKLYVHLLRSDKFFPLKEVDRWVYIGLLLLAAVKKNKILLDLNFLKANICHHDFPLKDLEKSIISLKNEGLIAIKTLSGRYQDACLDKIRIEENRIDKEIDKEKPFSSKSFLLSIPETDLKELADKYSVSFSFIRSRAEDVIDYCAAKGKVYKDYKAALRNFIKSHIEKHPSCVITKKPEVKAEKLTPRSPEEQEKVRKQIAEIAKKLKME